ncbi:Large proline-rich protein bag6 [Stylosanthes scabra]|uniref:Large proline-rich protein bag6 n=1 Tax=Stylosanthes scabra TaxID=79078 RepID=A0ABU6SAV5_9FABA|nr:Large proline-rich protein bag6 [Stylosanthes scabra]
MESELVKCDEPEIVPPAVEEKLEPKQQTEEQEEVQSSEESSDGWVKDKFSKEGTQRKCARRSNQIIIKKEVNHVAEHNGELNNGDAELLEENVKLRNTMNRLLDAGNEQLKVISDLTERFKDLEEKLARSKKRMRNKRFKLASPSSLSKISSKNNAT